MITEAAALIIAATLSAVVAPLIAIAGKRWIETLPARRNILSELEKLWERCDKLQADLDDCKRDHAAALARQNELARALDDMCRGVAGCPLAARA